MSLDGQRLQVTPTSRTCPDCLTEGLAPEAAYCQACGARLPEYRRDPA